MDEVRYVVAALKRARPHVRLVRHLADVDDVTQGRVLVHEAVHVVGVLAHERARVELIEEVVDGDGERIQSVEPLGQVLLHYVQVLVLRPVGAHRLPLKRQDDGIALDVDHVVDRHCGPGDAAVVSHHPRPVACAAKTESRRGDFRCSLHVSWSHTSVQITMTFMAQIAACKKFLKRNKYTTDPVVCMIQPHCDPDTWSMLAHRRLG